MIGKQTPLRSSKAPSPVSVDAVDDHIPDSVPHTPARASNTTLEQWNTDMIGKQTSMRPTSQSPVSVDAVDDNAPDTAPPHTPARTSSTSTREQDVSQLQGGFACMQGMFIRL